MIPEPGMPASVSTLAFAPDGKSVVAGLDNGDLEVLNVTNGAIIQTLDNRGTTLDSIVFSPDETLMAVARDFATAQDPHMKVWRASDWSTVNTMDAHGTKSAAFSPDGSLLASGSRVGDVNLWKVSDWSFEGWSQREVVFLAIIRILRFWTMEQPWRVYIMYQI